MSAGDGRRKPRWSDLKTDFSPGSVGSTIGAGLVLAVVNTMLSIALVSLIFRDGLAESLPVGIGIALTGSAVIGLVVALGSSFPGLYAGVQDAPAAIIGLGAVSVVGVLAGSQALDTVVAMMALTSLGTGLVLWAMGFAGWGEIARFVPFPVIGGLLAGTGYLILVGALGILGVASWDDAFTSDGTGLIWPALALAVTLFVATRRRWPSWIYLLFLGVAVGGFHLFAALGGVSRQAALDRGWLLGPFPDGGLWPEFAFSALVNADWGAIGGEVAGLVTVLVVVPITLLLYISAVEIETATDLDMNQELRATGGANLAASLIGGPPGYLYLADTVITTRLVGPRRGAALVAPAFLFGVVAFGGALLEFIPGFVVGGLLLFVSAEFFHEWLWASRKRMSRVDYSLLVGILLIVAFVGFLPGVASGLVAATFLFVLRYSRIDVVRRSLTGSDRQSNIERSLPESDYLRDHGSETLILELQGFIFFGTATRIHERFKAILHHSESVRFVIMDFKRVSGVDSSAVALFERVALLAAEHAKTMVFTSLDAKQSDQFQNLFVALPETVRSFGDLDHGIAWCEDQLLQDVERRSYSSPGLERLESDLAGYLVERRFEPGEVLMRQGDPSPGIFLLQAGRATVQLETDGNTPTRLRTLLPGTVLGEISLYRNEPCTATVVADDETQALWLSPRRFEELCGKAPAVAAELHSFVARVLAGRVSHSNRAIRFLDD